MISGLGGTPGVDDKPAHVAGHTGVRATGALAVGAAANAAGAPDWHVGKGSAVGDDLARRWKAAGMIAATTKNRVKTVNNVNENA